MKKSQAAMEFLMTYGWAILAAIIVIGILGYYYFSQGVFDSSENQTCNAGNCEAVEPKFCMAAVPNYLLDCKGQNGTMIVRADINTIDVALAKNNCTIIEQADQIEIGYCINMKVNETLTKYRISISEYSN